LGHISGSESLLDPSSWLQDVHDVSSAMAYAVHVVSALPELSSVSDYLLSHLFFVLFFWLIAKLNLK
jgi:hypothetical protein